jgi:hypothetical protein
MSIFSGKKLFLIGFIFVLLVAIPLTVYLAGQQQKTKSGAAKSTTLSLVESGKTNSDIATAVDGTFSIDVMVDPGSNFVNYTSFTLSYDPTKIATTDAGIVANSEAVTVFSGPTYGPSQISVTLTTANDQTKVIQVPTRIATITFKALAPTETAPTLVGFGNDTEILSTAPSDTRKENVLYTSNGASITITGSSTTSTIPSSTTSSTIPSSTTSSTVSTSTTTTTLPNQNPTCDSLVLDKEASGAAPLSITFTANGNDPDGTISKATFNFGDGTVNDVTTGGNIGTATVNAQANHVFNSGGSFTATAILTDNRGGTSTTTNCSKVIEVSGSAVTTTTTTVPPVTTSTIASASIPNPTVAPTGPGDMIMGIGAFGAILTVIGVVLLFAL